MHLRGAYSMASLHDVLSGNLQAGLLGAGFWNYLREDITFSLFQECPLKMNLEDTPLINHHHSDQDYLNSITLILGKIINMSFCNDAEEMRWNLVIDSLKSWRREYGFYNLAMGFSGIDLLEFETKSQEHLLEVFALEICGIAFTAKTPSVLVNAFGPIAYCARFIRDEASQQELIRQLLACKSSIGWPVERLIGDLRTFWETDQGSSGGQAMDL
ncbi:hypothetical protein NW762_008661 [Fusarium torreyae]|uniref:Uncharacterized protein n=1 Tax=Fusarium torreyae TaxID=1237075 RepID=A0A9W8RX12_9HYPO|nr:hypothetical protein NW762_008661 [Fusarium torreyae]